jgi:hypothetical protein
MAIPLGTSATRQTSGRRSAATSRGFYCSAGGPGEVFLTTEVVRAPASPMFSCQLGS